MFGKKKNKKSPKIEKVFEGSSEEEQVLDANNEQSENQEHQKSDIDEFLGIEEQEEDFLTAEQKEKVEQLNNVKSKISQILRSTNIEIIDENIGDEYESDGSAVSEAKSQQDYDSLKAIFGDKDKNKKQELTLTIDDFDYTYVGQYLDEYDLMHMKNIKRIRLQKKYPKWLKKAVIISSIVLVVGLGVFLGIFFTRDVPVYLKNVTLSQVENDYYIDQIFKYKGIKLIAEYSDGTKKEINLDSSHLKDITGRVERVGENQEDIQFVNGTFASLTFTYQGFDVEYTVNILKKVESGVKVVYAPGIFNVPTNGYIDSSLLYVFVDYGGFGTELIKLSSSNIKVYVDNVKCAYENGKGFKVPAGTTADSEIKIEYVTEKNETITVVLDAENYTVYKVLEVAE